MKTSALRVSLTLAVGAFVLAAAQPTQAAVHKRAAKVATATFQVAPNARIAVGANASATLADLKSGDRVTVAYDRENGALVAHHIADGVPSKARQPKAVSKSVTKHHKNTLTLVHVHGVVQAVNLQARTLTVAAKPQRAKA